MILICSILTVSQEELDLSVLSAEARRSLAQPPTLMNANVPHVAVVVKVPLIAVKYPMSNGQVMLSILKPSLLTNV